MSAVLQFFDGLTLVALTVAIHSIVLGWSLYVTSKELTRLSHSLVKGVWLFCRLGMLIVVAHLGEIFIWGLYYYFKQAIGTFDDALYFSAVTYATIGYGDIVPPLAWRLTAAMEGLVGILMGAWSGGYFFAVVQMAVEQIQRKDQEG